jgi:hypothetical protein
MRNWFAKARTPIAICIGNRLALIILMYLGLVLDGEVDQTLRPFLKNLFLDGWFRWDSGWYLWIVEHGYQAVPDNAQQPTNFWPLYPMLVRLLNWAIGNPFIAGFVVSNGALLCSCVMLYRYLSRRFGEDVAGRSVTLLLCYPFSFYFSAMYTESVFLLGAVGAFYFSQRKRWLLASLCAAMAGATRLVGVMVVLPVVLAYAECHHWKLKEVRRDVLLLPVGLAGTLGHMLFLHVRFGDALAFLRSQWVFGWGDNSSWSRLMLVADNATTWRQLATGAFDSIATINLAFGILALLVCLAGFRRFGVAVAAWGVITMVISLRIWASSGRYAVVIWPMFLGIALITRKRPYLYQGIVTGFCFLQALFAFWFAHGHWVG